MRRSARSVSWGFQRAQPVDQINANSLIRSDQMGSGVMAGIIILQSGLSGPGWVNGLDEAQSIVLSFRTPHRIGRVGGGSEPPEGFLGTQIISVLGVQGFATYRLPLDLLAPADTVEATRSESVTLSATCDTKAAQ